QSTDKLMKLVELFACDVEELVATETYTAGEVKRKSEEKRNIKMQMAAAFGRVFILVGFVGYMSINMNEFGSLSEWYPKIWWGAIFFMGLVFTFIGSWDYYHRKFGTKKVLCLDVLFVFSIFLYDLEF